MKVVACIEPPQAEVIERILRRCGLGQDRSSSRAPPDVDDLAPSLDTCYAGSQAGVPQPVQTQEPTYVDIDTFLATFRHHRSKAWSQSTRLLGRTPI